MDFKYKPEKGFEFDKFDLFQKDGKYYYKYKTLNETFEETINKSIYEELRKEKELFLSLRNCELKDLWWMEKVSTGLFGYTMLCVLATIILLFLQIINIVCIIFDLKIDNDFPLPIYFIFVEIFILFQIFLSIIATCSYNDNLEQAIEIYQEFEQNITKIHYFNTREIYEKFNYKLDTFNRYQLDHPGKFVFKGEKNEI